MLSNIPGKTRISSKEHLLSNCVTRTRVTCPKCPIQLLMRTLHDLAQNEVSKYSYPCRSVENPTHVLEVK